MPLFIAISWFGTEPAWGLLWLNAAAQEALEEADAFMEKNIIHFLMMLKYRQRALERCYLIRFPVSATAAVRELLGPVC